MDRRDVQARRQEQARTRQLRARRARFLGIGSLIAVVAGIAAVVVGSSGGSGSHPPTTSAKQSTGTVNKPATTTQPAGKLGTATVPILAYHVVNVPPAQGGTSAQLYVPADEFSAQMDALKSAGWSAVTLDQLEAYWTRGTRLGSGKPIVITFDDGYASQYSNALPVLRRLGWVGVENLRVSGLPPSEGGLTDSQIRGLIAAGWELDAEGSSQPDLTTLAPDQVRAAIASDRQTLRSRYRVPVNWFGYPAGHYNPTVTAAVTAAGFTGATTLAPGWASPQEDRSRLPRLQVNGGTTPSQLLSQIASAQQNTSTPQAS
jgi:peptidoglycan/xylan/chitin deacetylase (PgdA/CDA1 family)